MANTTQQKQSEQANLTIPSNFENAPLMAAVRSGEPTTSSIKPLETESLSIDKTIEFQWKFAEETHQYIRDYIKQADQKAAFFFAVTTALITFLYKVKLVQRWVQSPTQWIFVDMLSFVATIGLAVSAFACLATVFPRMRGSKRGVVFFSAISEFESRKDYATEVLHRDIGDLMEEKLCHVHDLATICGRKFSVLKIGQWSGAIGIVATVLLLLLAS